MRRLHEMSYVELEKHAIEVISELKIKAYGAGYEQGKFDAEMEAGFKAVVRALESDQDKRDRIVKQAKEDVKELRRRMSSSLGNREGNSTFRIRSTKASFVVNKNKRTIVALIKGARNPVLYEKGIAKCAPNDCFNVHIGKAISLRRALGLDVPSEYVDAPQPTEVRVGDVVKAPDFEFIRAYTVDNIRNLRAYDYDGTYLPYDDINIIDDSREGVTK